MLTSIINSPRFSKFYGCHIEINDKRIPGLYELVSEIRVEASRKMASTATLKFSDIAEADGQWNAKDSSKLKIGKKIKVTVNFGSHDETLFVGYIISTHSDYPEGAGTGTYTLQCQDESIEMDQIHNRINWSDPSPISDGMILANIAREYKLKLDAQNAQGLVSENLVQSESDIQFIRKRAKANGYEFMVFDGVIYFGPHRLSNRVPHKIMINAGKQTNCQDFMVSVDAHKPDIITFDIAEEKGNSLKSHEVRPNLKLLGQRNAKDSTAKIGKSQWWLCETGTPNFDEAESYAQGLINEESLRVKALGTLDSNLFGHVLVPMTVVTVDGASNDDCGSYYVDSVSHSLSHAVYTQSFELIRNGVGNDNTARPKTPVSAVIGAF